MKGTAIYRFAVLAILVAAAMVLTACGTDTRDPANRTPVSATADLGSDVNGLKYVGADKCINCHKGFTWSQALVAGYLKGKHVIHSDHITAASGDCLDCHDPVGDGRTIESLLNSLDVPASGLAAVTCEACHGAGGEHYGVGPMPDPRPDFNACGQCHSAGFYHNAYHPEGDNIVEDLMNSQHYNGGIRGDDANGDVNPKCSRCHTDEGARTYKYVQGTEAELTAYFANEPLVEAGSPIQCRTCHDPHDPTRLLRAESSSASAEFNTCTNCHQTGTISANQTGDLSMPYHRSGSLPRDSRTILDTHFDNSVTATVIEGYVIDRDSDRSCRDCHNVHLANVDPDSGHTKTSGTLVNRQWASSAHGGKIAETALVNGIANVTEAEAPAWVHYDFKSFAGGSCTRCHTATGFKALASDAANYDPAANTFTATGEQREMLFCWACHTSNAGGLRDIPAFSNTSVATYTDPMGRVANVPDLNGSNICMACHSGRETGHALTTVPTGSLANPHYLAAGGILFRTVGYEYAGVSYENKSYFKHDDIGIDNVIAPNTGSNGPCVGCHFRGDESNHTLTIINAGSAEIDNEITNVCGNCHGSMTVEVVEAEKAGFTNALAALDAELQGVGVYWANAHPYFYTVPGSTAALDRLGTAAGYSGVPWPNDIDIVGAAFNLNLLRHEPGAFTHNRYYTKRLIYDAIDYLQNGVVNSGSIDLSAAPGAAAWYQGDVEDWYTTGITNTGDDNAVVRK